jgi:hypothetical protein
MPDIYEEKIATRPFRGIDGCGEERKCANQFLAVNPKFPSRCFKRIPPDPNKMLACFARLCGFQPTAAEDAKRRLLRNKQLLNGLLEARKALVRGMQESSWDIDVPLLITGVFISLAGLILWPLMVIGLIVVGVACGSEDRRPARLRKLDEEIARREGFDRDLEREYSAIVYDPALGKSPGQPHYQIDQRW